MKIIISNSNDKPIYEQISEEIKNAIFNGKIKGGDPLPSIRGLAKELKVSVITTKRAFEELEKEGLIETVRGKGSYVKGQNQALMREKRISELEQKLSELIEESRVMGLTKDEFYEMLDVLFEEE